MNQFGYLLGYFYRLWTVISFPICVILIFLYLITHREKAPIFTVAPVITINKDGTVSLLSDNNASIYKPVAINTAEKIAQVIYGFNNGGDYVANVANISKLIYENDSAAKVFRDKITKNVEMSKTVTATFTLDRDKTIAQVDPNDQTIMVVLVHGFQTLSSSTGTTTSRVSLNLVMYFNETRGEDGNVFKVTEISFN